MSTKYVDETCRQKSFRPNYVDKMSSTKYAVDLSAVDEVSIDKMFVGKVCRRSICRQMICNSIYIYLYRIVNENMLEKQKIRGKEKNYDVIVPQQQKQRKLEKNLYQENEKKKRKV